MRSFFQKYQPDIKRLFVLVSLLILARIVFIALMPHTFSKDLYAWLRVIEVLRAGGNPYQETGVLNWPPFWMQMLYGVKLVSAHTHISEIHLIQSILIAGEILVMLITYCILKRYFIQNPFLILLFGLALNPVCIFLSCQHCNFDVFAGCWILLFTWKLLEFYKRQSIDSWLMACFFLGMGILTKTIPLILIPFLFTGIQKQKPGTWISGLILLFTPILIGMSIIYSLAPQGVNENVLQYRSLSGWYGITGILNWTKANALNHLYQSVSPYIFLALIVFLTRRFLFCHSLEPAQLIMNLLAALIFIPTFGPGYSPPYLLWFLPLLVILFAIPDKSMKRVLIIGYFILAGTYIFEYTFFPSHGAFLVQMFSSQELMNFNEKISTREMQTLVRIPMFLFYILLFTVLVRKIKKYGKYKGNGTPVQ